MKTVLRILLMCEFEKSELAGGESVVLGLIDGLIAAADARFEIVILTSCSLRQIIEPRLKPPHRVVSREVHRSKMDGFKAVLRTHFPGLLQEMRRAFRKPIQGLPSEVSELDTYSSSLGADVIHWIYPLHFQISKIPSVCTIHDFNYEFLREDFTPSYIEWRRKLMQAQISNSKALITISETVLRDLRVLFSESAAKATTIRWAPFVTPGPASTESTSTKCKVDGEYVLYPAALYKHKNHATLFEAMKILNSGRQQALKLVLTGPVSEYWYELRRSVEAEIESGQIVHLGFVTRSDLEVLYKKALLVVFPSTFEGAGLPLLEAMAMQKPICCSEIPVFREFGKDYPIYFDPNSAESIRVAIEAGLQGRSLLASNKPIRTWVEVATEYLNQYCLAANDLTESN